MGRKSKLRKLEAAAGLRSRAPATAPRGPHEPVQPIGTPAQRWVNWLVPSLIAFLTSAAFLPTLQNAGGGTWAGCVYDVDAIVAALEKGCRL